MKVIITLAGHSERFKRLGYPHKALIPLFGKLIIEHVVSMFDIGYEDLILVARSDCSTDVLSELFDGAHWLYVEPNNDGPVVSLLSANLGSIVGPQEEVVISYCDFYMHFDLGDMLGHMRSLGADGGIVTHSGFHPHRLYNSSFAHLRQSGCDVLEVKEKGCFTGDHMKEPASSGVYYFRRFEDMDRYFRVCVDTGCRVNNEFYVTMPFNDMIADGLRVVAYCVDNYVCLGTPRDLHLVRAWRTILDSVSDVDVLPVYRYWRNMFVHFPRGNEDC